MDIVTLNLMKATKNWLTTLGHNNTAQAEKGEKRENNKENSNLLFLDCTFLVLDNVLQVWWPRMYKIIQKCSQVE